MIIDNPIESLAAAFHAACLRDLPEIHYRDRNWTAYRKYMDGLSREQKAEHIRLEKESGEITEHFIEKLRRPSTHDCEVAMFPQIWGSTALGYGGIGGQAMTQAYTVVVTCRNSGCTAVYFGSGGRLAYLVPSFRQNEKFMADIQQQRLASCKDAKRLYGLPDEDVNAG